MILLSDMWNGFASLPLGDKALQFLYCYIGLAIIGSGIATFVKELNSRTKLEKPIGMFLICATISGIGVSWLFLLFEELAFEGAELRKGANSYLMQSDPAKWGDPTNLAWLNSTQIWLPFDYGGPPMSGWTLAITLIISHLAIAIIAILVAKRMLRTPTKP